MIKKKPICVFEMLNSKIIFYTQKQFITIFKI